MGKSNVSATIGRAHLRSHRRFVTDAAIRRKVAPRDAYRGPYQPVRQAREKCSAAMRIRVEGLERRMVNGERHSPLKSYRRRPRPASPSCENLSIVPANVEGTDYVSHLGRTTIHPVGRALQRATRRHRSPRARAYMLTAFTATSRHLSSGIGTPIHTRPMPGFIVEFTAAEGTMRTRNPTPIQPVNDS